MFTLKTVISQRVICFTYQNFIRCMTKDPGIGFRKKLLGVDERESELPDFDDLESDFMDVSKSHKQHLRELEARKEWEKYLLVRQKYFKEKFPNFLTWHDKEQIRYLYRTDPEEWSIDKLSEGFPALPETIKKIVKSNWTKDKPYKIINHDKSVKRNWELFKKGEMQDLPEELKEHLNKFTNRALNFNTFVAPDAGKQTFQVKNKNVKPEFSEIITSYEQMKRSKVPQIEDKIEITKELPKQPLKKTHHVTSKSGKSSVTLDHLQEKIKIKLETGKPINDEEKLILVSLKSQEGNEVEKANVQMDEIIQNRYQSAGTVKIYNKAERDLSHLNYPEKISIPKTIFKKDFIYKLNDCYYDDDGEFLYRVPGMG